MSKPQKKLTFWEILRGMAPTTHKGGEAFKILEKFRKNQGVQKVSQTRAYNLIEPWGGRELAQAARHAARLMKEYPHIWQALVQKRKLILYLAPESWKNWSLPTYDEWTPAVKNVYLRRYTEVRDETEVSLGSVEYDWVPSAALDRMKPGSRWCLAVNDGGDLVNRKTPQGEAWEDCFDKRLKQFTGKTGFYIVFPAALPKRKSQAHYLPSTVPHMEVAAAVQDCDGSLPEVVYRARPCQFSVYHLLGISGNRAIDDNGRMHSLWRLDDDLEVQYSELERVSDTGPPTTGSLENWCDLKWYNLIKGETKEAELFRKKFFDVVFKALADVKKEYAQKKTA